MQKAAFFLYALLLALPFAPRAQARDLTTDCYVATFDGAYTVQKSASLDVVEQLLVDCGTIPNKHGIFRVLPYTLANRPAGEDRNTPVHLLSINDARGTPYHYEQSYDRDNHTVTWKIGDPKVTITGKHTYVIHYTVDNVIQHTPAGDLFAWNLSGNFWLLDIDSFTAKVRFPDGLSGRNVTTQVFTGEVGSEDTTGAQTTWAVDEQQRPIVAINSLRGLKPENGITLYATAPAGSFAPYQLSWLQKFGSDLWYLLIAVGFLLLWRYWQQYGKDPEVPAAQMVFYAAPGGLRPMQLGLLDSFGVLKDEQITASIVDLAVRGYLTITEIPKQGLLGKTDWQLTLKKKPDDDLRGYEAFLLSSLFSDDLTLGKGKAATVLLSSLKNKFYQEARATAQMSKSELDAQGLFDKEAHKRQLRLGGLAFLFLAAGIWLAIWRTDHTPYPPLAGPAGALIGVGIVTAIFAFIMSRRTEKGAQLEYELKGFKEYMSKAEKYRSQFYEKENMFETVLPYAIVFGLTSKWIKAMRSLYTPEQMATYAPVWYLGAGGNVASISSFDTFASQVNALSQQISAAATPPSSSGSGGGFSGGGGGGGGGGSW